MGLFDFFSGKSPETHEQRGDKFVESGAYGDARIEYETALHKIERKFPEKVPLSERIQQKMRRAGELLAQNHIENADVLTNAGDHQEALELLNLALELTGDEKVKHIVSGKIQTLAGKGQVSDRSDSPDDGRFQADFQEDVSMDIETEAACSEEELFSVLCHALPEPVEHAYQSYGVAFRQGYIALNHGDFETAAARLGQALEENEESGPIALELATAHIHLQNYDYARELLQAILERNPEEIRAYQLACEIYWDTRDYREADRLLAGCPESLREAPAILLLTGETRFLEKAYDAAEAAFNRYIELNGPDEIASRALAKTLEAKGDLNAAREIYAQILNQCVSCRTRVDPFLKRRYAELSFETGDTSNRLLDIFLALTQEDPANRPAYYQRIARIYEKRGDLREARRYAAFGTETL